MSGYCGIEKNLVGMNIFLHSWVIVIIVSRIELVAMQFMITIIHVGGGPRR